MAQRVLARCGAVATGALSVYALGRVWLWYLVGSDPAPAAIAAPPLLAVGVLASFLPSFPRISTMLTTAAVGLYGGWLIRALLLGDVPAGPGVEFMVSGMILGAAAGIRRMDDLHLRQLRGLRGALFGALAGAGIVAPILDSLGLVALRSPLHSAPSVLACGAVGWIISARSAGLQAGRTDG